MFLIENNFVFPKSQLLTFPKCIPIFLKTDVIYASKLERILTLKKRNPNGEASNIDIHINVRDNLSDGGPGLYFCALGD